MTLRHVALALAAVATAAAVATVLGADRLWTTHRSSSRAEVDRYIRNVDAIEQQMRLPLTHLLTAYRGYSSLKTTKNAEQRIAQGTRTLRTLERRIAALHAPPAATTLRRLLLQLVEQERLVAQETEQLAQFLPRFTIAMTQSRSAQTQLARALAAINPPTAHAVRGTRKKIARARAAFDKASARAAAEQADAINAYDRSLARVAGRLRRLQPPPVMAPAYRTQLRTLAATQAAGVALARELLKKNRSRVPLLDRRLTEAARLARTVASQQAEIAAIRAYDARVKLVGAIQGNVQLEVSRLARAG